MLLCLVCTLLFSFSSLDCLYLMYFTIVRSKLEYISLFGIQLWLWMLTNWNASSTSLLLMHCSLLKFTLVLNSVLTFWRLLVFESVLGMSENFHCSVLAVQLKITLLLDMH
jgi:hypothetical protein